MSMAAQYHLEHSTSGACELPRMCRDWREGAGCRSPEPIAINTSIPGTGRGRERSATGESLPVNRIRDFHIISADVTISPASAQQTRTEASLSAGGQPVARGGTPLQVSRDLAALPLARPVGSTSSRINRIPASSPRFTSCVSVSRLFMVLRPENCSLIHSMAACGRLNSYPLAQALIARVHGGQL